MKRPKPHGLLVGLSLIIALAVPTRQQPTTDDLKKEIDSLRTMLRNPEGPPGTQAHDGPASAPPQASGRHRLRQQPVEGEPRRS